VAQRGGLGAFAVNVNAVRPMRRAALLLVAAGVALMLPLGSAGPAGAHRDGCHRWHSCPSDTGSYVCGDLGYDSQCGGTGSDVEELLRADATAPDRPRLRGISARPGGVVLVRVSAERGSTIVVVDEAGEQVARATAKGGPQSLSFRARDGAHEYTVRATDETGNESETTAAVSVTADSSPPTVAHFALVPGSPAREATVAEFSTEAGARWQLSRHGGTETIRGVADGSGSVHAELWLRNGRHTYDLVIHDAAGNERRARAAVEVAIDAPSFAVTRVSAANARPVVFRVSGSPRSNGRLTVSGQEQQSFSIGAAGSADVAVRLPDGSYPGATVELIDFQGRRATRTAPAFEVDTLPPSLEVAADTAAAGDGRLGVTVRVERDVHVDVRGSGTTPALQETFASSGTATAVSSPAAEGTYEVVVTATDAAGNTSRRSVRVDVADPLTAGEVLGAFALVFVLLLGGVLAWRRRDALAAALARLRRAAEQRRVRRELAVHEQRMVEHARAYADWTTRRDELSAVLTATETLRPQPPDDAARSKLRRDEAVYGTFTAGMVEVRQRDGQPYVAVIGEGEVTVTDQRILFEGVKRREWRFERMTSYTHDQQGNTLIGVANRSTISGLAHTETSHRGRLLLDLARADHGETRADLVHEARRRLASHDATRPTPPAPPTPPVTAPARTSTGV
jgi:hypothetical protein